MSPKITGLLGVCLLLLVGFVFFYERPKIEEEQKAIAAQKEFLDVKRQTVAKFTIVNRFGKFVAEKQGNDWLIKEPIETPGDWEQFEAMVTAARAVERGRVIVDAEAYDKTDLAAFGLQPPRVELRFESQSGDDIWLLFGDDNPAGRAAYLSWSGGNQIVLTQRSFRNRFDLKLLDLRDQRILPFDLDLVQRVVLKHHGKTFEMVRNGFRWQIVSPGAYMGDEAEINNILGTVRAERVVDIVAETFEDPTLYGFDTPSYQLTVGNKNGEARTLTLGKTVEDVRSRLWYASSSERPYVFLVEPFMTDFLNIDLGSIRYKRVFEFDRKGIDKIQLAYPDSTVTCVLEAGNWKVVNPAGYVATEDIVGTWIDKVHTMAVADFMGAEQNLDAYGLTQPVLTVSLWRGEALVREVLIGQGYDGWYGMMQGSDEVFSFDYGVMAGLRLPLGGISQ
jgi:hypothetical protein